MFSNSRDIVVVIDNNLQSDLWHYKLGYTSEKGMEIMVFSSKLLDLKAVDE